MPTYELNATKEEQVLADRLNKGKHSSGDIKAFRAMMKAKPGQLSKAADLCAVAYADAMRHASGGNALVMELVKDRRAILLDSLGYAEALPVEKLLIDEVALCWLRHYQTECRYSDMQAGDMTFAQAEYWERKVAATQRRYLRAIETFVRVGKLLRAVTVQVNIGQKQLNVAGDVAAANRAARRSERDQVIAGKSRN